MRRRDVIIVVLIGLLIVVLENGVLLPAQHLSYTFSLMYIGALVIGLLWPFQHAILWATITALVIDLFRIGPFGIFTLSVVLLVIIANLLKYTWLKQISGLSVFVISSISVIMAYGFMIFSHLLVTSIGLLDINPLTVITWQSLVVGIVIQCFIVSFLVRMFAVVQRYTSQ